VFCVFCDGRVSGPARSAFRSTDATMIQNYPVGADYDDLTYGPSLTLGMTMARG
jgi:hypothetical protein